MYSNVRLSTWLGRRELGRERVRRPWQSRRCWACRVREGVSGSAVFQDALKECRRELAARGLTRVSSGGYRLDLVPVHARLERLRWVPDGQEPPFTWQLLFAGPHATWSRGGLNSTVYAFRQDEQRRPALDFYPISTPAEVEKFLGDFTRFTLTTIDRTTSPDALIRLLLDHEIAPFGGWGKGNRKNAARLAHDVLSIAKAYDLTEAYRPAVQTILLAELDESPRRRSEALRIATAAGIALT